MDGSGAQNRWSISDEIAAKVNYSTTMQALCIAWLYPAISMVWAGFASSGLRSVDDEAVSAAVDRSQAVAVLLAIFTCLIGCIWAVRTWAYLPASELWRTRRRLSGPVGHVAAAVAVVPAVVGSVAVGRSSSLFLPLTTLACVVGCYAGLLLSRWLLRAPLERAFPVAAFSAAMMFQITVGWMHVVSPNGPLAALIVVEGLTLSWAAVAAARAVAATTVDLVSPVPALPPLPEPAVGH